LKRRQERELTKLLFTGCLKEMVGEKLYPLPVHPKQNKEEEEAFNKLR
jgi:hypothetical protein